MPSPRRRGRLVGPLAVAAVLILGATGAVIVGVTHQTSKPDGTGRQAGATEAGAPLPADQCGGGVCTTSPTDDPATVPVVTPLTAADIQLTVKTKTKDCFGSAGCNIEYTIKAAIGRDVEAQECEVTYDVHGLEDIQTGTLDFHSDGTYEQDGYQSGETTSSKKKLTAKVTDVDCSG